MSWDEISISRFGPDFPCVSWLVACLLSCLLSCLLCPLLSCLLSFLLSCLLLACFLAPFFSPLLSRLLLACLHAPKPKVAKAIKPQKPKATKAQNKNRFQKRNKKMNPYIVYMLLYIYIYICIHFATNSFQLTRIPSQFLARPPVHRPGPRRRQSAALQNPPGRDSCEENPGNDDGNQQEPPKSTIIGDEMEPSPLVKKCLYTCHQ